MENKIEVLAIVTARGNSKGLPGKNVRMMAGKPMVAWSVETALSAETVSRVVVSSDCPAIIAASIAAGAEAPFVRPESLSGDDVPGVAPVLHAVEWLKENEAYLPDWILLLQPTSPLRNRADIDGAVRLAIKGGAECVVGVTPASPHPYWTKRINAEGRLEDFVPRDHSPAVRQALPEVYAVNGAIYLVRTQSLLDSQRLAPSYAMPWVMPKERSVDVDDWIDFTLAEMLLEKGLKDAR